MEKYKLKVAPDNTISIKPVKEKLYSRDEIVTILRKLAEETMNFPNRFQSNTNFGSYDGDKLNKWIENNLN